MNSDRPLLRSTITASVLGVFWAVWLHQVSQAIFQAQNLRPWADVVSVDLVKWLFSVTLLIAVVLVAALLWSYSTHVGLKNSPLPREEVDQHWKLILASFLMVSLVVIALPVAAFVLFGIPTVWEVTVAAVVLPVAMLFIISSSD